MTDIEFIDLSNAKATKNWVPCKYENISLETAISTELVGGTSNVFAGTVPERWCTPGDLGLVAHGGYLTALVIATTRLYFEQVQSIKRQPDPTNVYMQFLDPVPSGNVKIIVHNTKMGRKTSVVRVEVQHVTKPDTLLMAMVTHGNFSTDVGMSIDIPKFTLLEKPQDCQRWTDAFFFNINPASAYIRTWTPRGGPSPLWSPSHGQNARDQWVRLDNGKTFDMYSLALICDLIPAIALNYESSALEGIIKWAFPTICLSVDIRRDPSGEEWLLQRIVTNTVKNGRYDVEVKIVDISGNLVATSTHACFIIPRATAGRPKALGQRIKAKAVL